MDLDSALGVASQGMQISAEAISTRRKNKRMLEWWERQNEYNSPKAQMQRLQEAGLNPNLIYGDSVSGATGKADSIGTPDKPNYKNPTDSITAFQDAKQRKAQIDLLQSQVETEAERKRLTSNQADKTYYEANNINYTDPTNELGKFTLEGMQFRNKNLKLDAIRKEIQNDIQDTTKAQQVARIFWEAENAKTIHEGRMLQNELLTLQKQFLNLGLDRNSPWYAKIFGNLVNKYNNR